VSQPVEELHFLLAVAPGRVVGRQAFHELADARAQLVRKVRRRRAHEPVDLFDCPVTHGPEA
jgi:hypothetical protein